MRGEGGVRRWEGAGRGARQEVQARGREEEGGRGERGQMGVNGQVARKSGHKEEGWGEYGGYPKGGRSMAGEDVR